MLEIREPSVVLSVDEHVETVYQIIAETLALGRPGVFPRFHELLDEVFRQRRPATASPPWLMLPIFACEALHGDLHHAQQVAAAFELGRLAAGCLDEWQDQDSGDAMWQAAGPARTVNAATAMLALSFLSVARLADLGLLGGVVLALQREFQQAPGFANQGPQVGGLDLPALGDLAYHELRVCVGQEAVDCRAAASLLDATDEILRRRDEGAVVGLVVGRGAEIQADGLLATVAGGQVVAVRSNVTQEKNPVRGPAKALKPSVSHLAGLSPVLSGRFWSNATQEHGLFVRRN